MSFGALKFRFATLGVVGRRGLPSPPAGFAYWVDDNGAYFVDDDGAYFLLEK